MPGSGTAIDRKKYIKYANFQKKMKKNRFFSIFIKKS